MVYHVYQSPLQKEKRTDIEYLYFLEGRFLLDCLQIREAPRTNSLLSRVMAFVNNKWPSEMEEDLKPFYTKDELITEQSILM